MLQITEDYLPMHGVNPMQGRTFTRADMEDSAPLVALIGYGYWQSHYGGGDVLGETIQLETDIATIVGVLPSWFNARTPVTIPHRVSPNEFGRRGTGRVSVYARLRDGVTIKPGARAPRGAHGRLGAVDQRQLYLEIWRFGDLEIWGFGDLEIERFGDLRSPNPEISRSPNFKLNSGSVQ